MRVINSHKRTINQPIRMVYPLFKTLASPNDLVWPYEKWPAIKFKNGLHVGSEGGHGRIRYTIIKFIEGKSIKFQFSKPEGFIGTHELKIEKINSEITLISHEIRMETSLKATLLWVFIIRWLHNALIKDAFIKVENYFVSEKREIKHSFWVLILREIYKRKSSKTKLT
jgi:hypothetical protein